MQNRTAAVVAVSILMMAGGCPSVAPPPVFFPGTPADQMQRATQFDPYPDQDAGPATDGARPREYLQPTAEVNRARNIKRSPWDVPGP